LIAGAWWALVVAPAAAWVFLANVFHDACHFALCSRWEINAALPYLTPWLSSP
jgi:fatty acid desaturase